MTGGGTAGHIIPNIALLPKLKQNFEHILYIGSEKGMEKDLISAQDIPFRTITCEKFRRKLTLENLKIPYRVYSGYRQAKTILEEFTPDVVFSKGGYVSLPVVYAAHSLKIPVVAHESDFTPGLANRLSARCCTRICTTFEQTASKLKRGVYTGSPIRSDLYHGSRSVLRSLPFSGKKPILLCMGGSSGAASLNDVLRRIKQKLPYHIIHLTGTGKAIPSENTSDYFQIEYTHHIEDYLAAADLVISRAGSNAIFELLALRKPTLLIPLPKTASRGDQIDNAKYFTEKGLSHMLLQEDLTDTTLYDAILSTDHDRANLIRNMTLYPKSDGTEQIVQQILQAASESRKPSLQ